MPLEITISEKTEIKERTKLVKINNLRLAEDCVERYLCLYERKRAGIATAPELDKKHRKSWKPKNRRKKNVE
jgi:hypothetical protein